MYNRYNLFGTHVAKKSDGSHKYGETCIETFSAGSRNRNITIVVPQISKDKVLFVTSVLNKIEEQWNLSCRSRISYRGNYVHLHLVKEWRRNRFMYSMCVRIVRGIFMQLEAEPHLAKKEIPDKLTHSFFRSFGRTRFYKKQNVNILLLNHPSKIFQRSVYPFPYGYFIMRLLSTMENSFCMKRSVRDYIKEHKKCRCHRRS